MLTARDTVDDRVRGLDAGADDYLVKPFAAAELLARLRSLGRRITAEPVDLHLQVDDLVVDLFRHEVTRAGESIDLTPREYALLEYLVRNQGRVLPRTQILADSWQYDAELASNIVDIYVHYLRDKIDRKAKRKLLHTVRGAGYVCGLRQCLHERGSDSRRFTRRCSVSRSFVSSRRSRCFPAGMPGGPPTSNSDCAEKRSRKRYCAPMH